MSRHHFFYPFTYANCEVPNNSDPSILDQIKDIMDIGVPLDADGNYPQQMAVSDLKTASCFTLDQAITITGRTYSNGRIFPDTFTFTVAPQPANQGLATVGLGDQDDTLYVVGHCVSGQDYMSAPNLKENCTDLQLFALLQSIPPHWPGKLKIYGCNTASSGWWGATQSFAKRLHTRLRGAGYVCPIYGYTHSVADHKTSYTNPTTGIMEMRKAVGGVRSHTHLQLIQ